MKAPSLMLIGSAVMALGCHTESGSNLSSITVDSAGIRIVSSSRPAWGNSAPWRVELQPQMVVGRDDHRPGHGLFRVSDIAFLSDGSVVVANGGSGELRVFDRSGALLASMGRAGDGPGEFRFLSDVTVGRGDTLRAWEAGGRGVSTFTRDGALVDSRRLMSDALPRFQNAFAPASEEVVFFMLHDPTWKWPGAATRGRELLARMEIGGSSLDTLGEWPTRLGRMMEVGGGEGLFGTARIVIRPLSPDTYMALGGRPERLLVGDGALPRLQVFDLHGVRFMEIQWNAPQRTLSEGEISQAIQASVAQYPEPERARRISMLREFPFEEIPTFSQIIVDDLGYVWTKRSQLPGVSPAQWDVFSPVGEWLGPVDLDATMNVMAISENAIAGVRRDEFDVEIVVLYVLKRVPT